MPHSQKIKIRLKMIRRMRPSSAISLAASDSGNLLILIYDRYAPFVRLLCPPLRDRYAHPYDCYAPHARPLCPPFTTAMPRRCDCYAHPMRPLCPLIFVIAANIFLLLHMNLVLPVYFPGFKNATFAQFFQCGS